MVFEHNIAEVHTQWKTIWSQSTQGLQACRDNEH